MSRTSRWAFGLVCLVIGGSAGAFLAGGRMHADPAADPPPAAPVLPKEFTSYRDVAKRVLPAIVSIQGKAKARPRRGALDERRPGSEDVNVGFGSGVLVDPKGVILTCYHVIDEAETFEVKLTDGRKFTTTDVRGDRKTDLAIVRIQSKDPLPFLELGDSSQMEIGDRVLAAGAPFGLDGSMTHGIVSAKGRSLRLNTYEDFIQTDAPINPGNSGGPLLSLEGKVIGINSAIKTRSGGFQGVGLAIASNMAKNVMASLLKDGAVKRGYLGVNIKDLTPELAAQTGAKNGVVVARVIDKTPAADGGVKPGDVIVSVGGKQVRDSRELQFAVAALAVNMPSDVVVMREGKPVTLKITIKEQPENDDE